jgi:hypothetical protein
LHQEAARGTKRSFPFDLFYDAPAGALAQGLVFQTAPDLTSAVDDPRNGYWHCNIAKGERLTWSDQVYRLFGLDPGTPVERRAAVARYSPDSAEALEGVRAYSLRHKNGFLLDATILGSRKGSRWIRVLAVPIVAASQVIGLHGLKRAL